MALDEPFLFSVSIRDNIAYGRPDATTAEIEQAARAAGADDFINDLPDGYDTIVGERGFTLSGGQRQRIAIARVLVLNPPILVLDDATSAIDVQTEQRIHEALRGLMANRTTLIVAHRLATISLADRVAVIEDGRVIAEGTHQHLMATDPHYVEILARTEEDARQREAEADARRAAHEADDERLLEDILEADRARARELQLGEDDDVERPADLDAEATPQPRGAS
jgi:ATP-binding cassette subfamily B protein